MAGGSARTRGPGGRITRSTPVEETPEEEFQDVENIPLPTRRSRSSALTPSEASQPGVSQSIRQGKRPVPQDNGETSSHPQQDSSTLSAGIDTQVQAQLARITELERQLVRQIELT